MSEPLQPLPNVAPDAATLVAALYDELRRLAAARMAKERPGQTLSPTALVHEVWLRIGGDRPDGWANRGQFFAAAAEAMRRILVENARRKGRLRHGGGLAPLGLTDLDVPARDDPERTLALDDAIERLAAVDARLATIAKLRLYAALGEAEVAEVVGTSARTVRRDWQYARAWLFQALGG